MTHLTWSFLSFPAGRGWGQLLKRGAEFWWVGGVTPHTQHLDFLHLSSSSYCTPSYFTPLIFSFHFNPHFVWEPHKKTHSPAASSSPQSLLLVLQPLLLISLFYSLHPWQGNSGDDGGGWVFSGSISMPQHAAFTAVRRRWTGEIYVQKQCVTFLVKHLFFMSYCCVKNFIKIVLNRLLHINPPPESILLQCVVHRDYSSAKHPTHIHQTSECEPCQILIVAGKKDYRNKETVFPWRWVEYCCRGNKEGVSCRECFLCVVVSPVGVQGKLNGIYRMLRM